MTRKLKITFMMCVALLLMPSLTSCKTTTNKRFKGGEKLTRTEGWKKNDIYEMVVVGQWDRDRYYIEGETPQDGKRAKAPIGLQADSKRAAQVVAMRNFKAKMGEYVKSKTGVEDGRLIGDVIETGLQGVSISPSSIVENYTATHDCRITFQFSAKNLKKTVDDMANAILNKKNELSSDALEASVIETE